MTQNTTVDWRTKPCLIYEGEPKVTYTVFFDENGNSNLANIAQAMKSNKDINSDDVHFSLLE